MLWIKLNFCLCGTSLMDFQCQFCNIITAIGRPEGKYRWGDSVTCVWCKAYYVLEDEGIYMYRIRVGLYDLNFYPKIPTFQVLHYISSNDNKTVLDADELVLTLNFLPDITPFNAAEKLKFLLTFH